MAEPIGRNTAPLTGDVARWRVRRSEACDNCGLCVEVCPTGAHPPGDGYGRLPQPRHERCVGPGCLGSGRDCATECPPRALEVAPAPDYQLLGDSRWPADLLRATWYEAQHGVAPRNGLEYRVGHAGGGFDALRFVVEEGQGPGAGIGASGTCQTGRTGRTSRTEQAAQRACHGDPAVQRLRDEYRRALEQVDLRLPLNRRGDGEQVVLPVPWYGAGMGLRSASDPMLTSRAIAAHRLGTFLSTGALGFGPQLEPYRDHVIVQVAGGFFGVREEMLQRARIIEVKFLQGAKPGIGGITRGARNGPAVAALREVPTGGDIFTPGSFHSIYSVEDFQKQVDWIRAINPRAVVSCKGATPANVEMVAMGVHDAGVHVIHLDGGYAGTSASYMVAKKNIGMPLEYAIGRVHRFLTREGVRDRMTLMVGGGLRTPYDLAKAIALGADGGVLGMAELVALECVRCANCSAPRACPRGIATHDEQLSAILDPEWGAGRIANMYSAWRGELALLLRQLGMESIAELRGRPDLLRRLG